MKILNAICFQNFGGVEQVFCDYGAVLKSRGHQIGWIISDKYLNRYENGKVFKLKNFTPILDYFHILWIVLRFRPDVIFCHSPRAMKLVRFLKLFSLVKTCAVNHSTNFKHAKNCHYVISVNEQINQDLIKSGFDYKRAFVVQNAVQITEKYQIKEIKKIPTIGIYGRVEKAKGFDILIKAAGDLKRNGVDFRLKIGGFEVSDSFTFKDLKHFAEAENILDKCDFVGLVRDKKEFFANVDILTVPSYHETFGMVILEGFLFSTLVISSTTNGGKFLINDGENGLLFENENHVDLAKKIQYILQNPSLYKDMTQKAFLRLEKEFSFDSLGNEIEKILQIITKN